MYTFIIVLIALVAILLIFVVLIQSSKGSGLAGIAAGGAATQILGARQAADVLERATWTLAAMFLGLCILSNFAINRGEQSQSVIQQRVQEQPAQTEQQAPALPVPQQQTPQQNPEQQQ